MPLQVNTTCGLNPMATDKTRQVPETELKETSFVWIETARDDFLKGSALDPMYCGGEHNASTGKQLYYR
jgi:hypothetical protein